MLTTIEDVKVCSVEKSNVLELGEYSVCVPDEETFSEADTEVKSGLLVVTFEPKVEDGLKTELPELGDDDNDRLAAEPEGEPFTMTGLPVIDEAIALEFDDGVAAALVFVVNITGLPASEVEFCEDDTAKPADEDDVLLEPSSEFEVEFPAGLSSLAPQTPLLVIPELMASFI